MTRMNITLMAGLALALAACSDPDGARVTAENHGLTNVQVVGHRFWGCDGRSTFWSTEITAMTAQGREVRGIVCRNLFLGSTLRLY